ncbi:MAG: hypothetical protein Cons2KO_30460 [Congregibacter sp.]
MNTQFEKRKLQNRRHFALFTALMLSMLSVLWDAESVAQSSFETADGYYENANFLITEGDRAGAVIQLRNALRIEPNHAPSMLSLGEVLLADGEPAEAVLALNDALLLGADPFQVVPTLVDAYLSASLFSELLRDLEPSNAPKSLRGEVFAAHAQALLAQGRTAAAGREIARAKSEDPSLYRLGLAEVSYLLQRRERVAALSVARGLTLQRPKDTRSWNAYASALHALGRLAEAISAYKSAILHDERNVDARIALIDLLMETQQTTAAKPNIEFLRKLYPTEPRAVFYSSLLAARLGDTEKEQQELTLATSLFAALDERQLRGSPQHLMLAALSSYGSGANERTAFYIDAYLELRPEDEGALRLKASNLLSLGDASTAIRTLLPVYQRNPNDVRAAALLAAAYGLEGDHKRAAELLGSLRDVRPDDDELERQLALTRLDAGDLIQGTATLERLYEQNPDSVGIALQLVLAYLRQDQPNQALELIWSLPDNLAAVPAVRNTEALALSRIGETEQAKSIWQQMLSHQGNSVGVQMNLASLYASEGKIDSALSLLADAKEKNPDAQEPLVLEAKLLLRRGSVSEALRSAEKALSIDQDDDAAAWQLIRSLLELDRGDEALEIARRFSAGHADSLPAAAILGRTYQALGQTAQASLVYTQMARQPDLSANDLHRIALLQRTAGALESADLSLSYSLQRNPGHRQAGLERTSLLLELGNLDDAVEQGRALLSLYPDETAAWLYLGDAFLRKGAYKEADHAFQEASRLGAVAWGNIGQYRTAMTAGNVTGAEAALRKGIEKTSGDVHVRAAMTDFLIAQERWSEANDELTTLLDELPYSPSHLNNRAFVRQRMGQLELAEQDARRALKVAPNYASANDTLGWILFELEKSDEALPFLREARARMGSSATVRYHLAAVLASLGRNREAINELIYTLEGDTAFPERPEAEALQVRLNHM